MADATQTPGTTPTAPRRGRRWLRWLGGIVGILVLLVVVLYFVGTSASFLKGSILPRVSKTINAEVTVSDASIHPFKEVVLQNLKVQATGAEPLLTVSEVHLRYSLMDIIGGKLNVAEVSVASPTITLVQNADKTSNLDPILKALAQNGGQKKAAEPAAKTPTKPGTAPQVDLQKFAVTDATLRMIKNYSGTNRDTAEVSHLNVALTGVKNGQSGKFEIAAEVDSKNNPPSGPAGSLHATLKGAYDFAFSPALKPVSVKGNLHEEVTHADGLFADLSTFSSDLAAEVTATEIKQIGMVFQKAGTRLGELRVSGPLDMEKMEGRLVAELRPVDKQLLNLVGAKMGLDFGPTTISSTNVIQLANGGQSITAGGQLDVNKLQVTRTNQTTPSLDLHVAYDVAIDQAKNVKTLRGLTLSGTENGSPILKGTLDSPMTLGSGDAGGAMGDSTLTIALTGFNLADWKPFLGESGPSGIISAQEKILSQKSGKLITVDATTQLKDLVAGANRITSGQSKSKLVVNMETPGQNNISGNIALSGFTGKAGATDFKDMALGADFDVGTRTNEIQIRKAQLSLSPTARATNQISLSGRLDTSVPGLTQGSLKLASTPLDFTTYYDVFVGGKKPADAASKPSATPPAPATKPAAGGVEKEPDPIKLPFHNFTMDVSIPHIYLHEIDIADVQVGTKLDTNTAVVNPCKLSMNGAPVTAAVNVDTGVPGFKYDVSFNANAIPLAPLVNSFTPERKGQVGGTLTAVAKIAGAGTTGASLQKNLTGNFDVGTTNLNLQVINIRSPWLKTLVDVVVFIPELVHNPGSAVTSLVGSIGGKGGGLSDELAKSPLDTVTARGVMGGGKVELQQAAVQSPAFRAEAAGAITLSDVLTNSAVQIPVSVYLKRSIAQQLNLVPDNTPTNAVYAKLPDFFTMKGTLGGPKSDVDKLALANTALKSVGVTGLEKKAESELGKLGGLFGGNKSSKGTNAPATNTSPAGNLFNQLLKPKK
jgi:hypothetical protein